MAVTFTQDQQKVIDTRNSNILVSAAAGSGKTAVLVERIIKMVSDAGRPVDIDRLLVVTFTNAAAAEMRERITAALSTRAELEPENAHLLRQLTLIHNAQITTIHSFCLYLIRNHFNEIGLDPDCRVADEGEIKLLCQDVLGELLEEAFASKDPDFLHCVECYAPAGGEKRLEELILSIYSFAMSYPWPEEWLREHRADYDVEGGTSLEETDWARLLKEYVHIMAEECADTQAGMLKVCEEPDGPYMYAAALESDRKIAEALQDAETLTEIYERLDTLSFARLSAKKDESVNGLKREEVKRQRAACKDILTKLKDKYFSLPPERLAEQMALSAPALRTLLGLTLSFKEKLEEKKREKDILDFHDMEHMALRILIQKDEKGVRPSQAALSYREHFVEILVDEYQDSNLVQEYLLQSISGEDEGCFNRFMVGDVKQSIYKFRLARPELFMEKFVSYSIQEGTHRRIDLLQNFRSRREVTESVNLIFRQIMGNRLGGVDYDDRAALYPAAEYPKPSEVEEEQEKGAETASNTEGASEEGASSGTRGRTDPYETELLIAASAEDGLNEREREALLIASRIREIVGKLPVFDKTLGALRPASYKDIVILLRAPSGWDETFGKVLEQCGIPVYITSRTGYFASTEVQTVLNFLRVLNNPLQDIPLFGTLRSRAGGFSDQDVAWLRAGQKERNRKLYHCVERYAAEGGQEELRIKASVFLEFIKRFRGYVSYMPIHQLIRRYLDETGYLCFIAALPGGNQRRANVEMLLTRAENFEKTSYFGLFHFIRYIEQVEKYNIDYGEANVQDENADTVRLMSIHKSKGLEFPVCFVAGLSKRFNQQDASQTVILDMDQGVATDYIDPVSRVRMPTLKKNVLAAKLRRDSLGEELRVLYVAMTRAKEKLILTASCKEPEKLIESYSYLERRGEELLPFSLRQSALSYLDWILPALSRHQEFPVRILEASDFLEGLVQEAAGTQDREENLRNYMQKNAVKKADLPLQRLTESDSQQSESPMRLPEHFMRLKKRLEWVYPHENLQGLYTKTTVSELKKAGMEETDEEAFRLFKQEEVIPYLPRFARGEEKLNGAARGSAYHKVMELYPFKMERRPSKEERTGDIEYAAGAEASGPGKVSEILRSMEESGRLSQEYAQAVNPEKIAAFLSTVLAARMAAAARRGDLSTEQPFVLGISARRLDEAFPEEETVLIQGIIDVWFEEEGAIVVADYKTDAVREAEELVRRYRTQLDYYALALERLTGKRVKEKILYSFALAKEIPLDH